MYQQMEAMGKSGYRRRKSKMRYNFYAWENNYKLFDIKELAKKIDEGDKIERKVFLREIAQNYVIFKMLLKLKEMKLVTFKPEFEEGHIKFVEALIKYIPQLEKIVADVKNNIRKQNVKKSDK